ncbi:PXA domain-containing protein [Boletus edulis]|nr:PXA domain-containing protein [Boletus edulis]
MAGQSRPQTGRSTRSAASTISYNVSASLARRLLFPHLPPGSDLPPLFLSEACPRELHDEAYDLTALTLRAFVNIWWTKLTRYDKEFLPQITSILIHVIRSLEHRLLDADLALLVFSDIPALITQHYRDYRQAVSKASTSYATGGALSLPQVFHQLQPHMAISADGSLDEEYFRQAIDHILRGCLPAEDYAPEAERFIVREIILKVVAKDVIPRITQPWFLQKMVLDMLGPSPDVLPESSASSASGHGYSRLSKSNIIVLLLSAIQKLSGTCIMLIHAYKQIIYIIPVVNQTSCLQTRASTRILNGGDEPVSGTSSPSPAPSTISTHAESKHDVVPPDLTRGPLGMISEVLRVQDRLAATALVQLVSLFCCSFQTFMNKLLCYLLYSYVLSASTILSVVRLSKRTLFPNGYPGPPPVDPTAEEQLVIRDELVKRIAERVPALARLVLLGDPAVSAVEGAVVPLSDEACNRHLAVFLLDALLLSVFPEMGS